MIQLDERLFVEDSPRLNAVFDPGVGGVVGDILERLDVRAVRVLDIVQCVERIETDGHMMLHVSIRVIRISGIAIYLPSIPGKD